MSGGGGSHNDLPKKKDDEWDRLLFDAFKHLGEWTHPRHKANQLAR